MDLGRRDLVALFLGETGHGKSTMVNSLINYIAFQTYDEAVGNIMQAIPQVWSIGNRTFHTSNWSPDIMIAPEAGQAVTMSITNYAMDGHGAKWRFLDTPGFADPKGIVADIERGQALIASFATLTHVDAIVIVVKGNLARATPELSHVIACIFSTLPKSITRNIIFAVTCCGESNIDDAATTIATFQALLTFLGTGQGYVLELNRNVFVFENKCFVTCTEESGGGRITLQTRKHAAIDWVYARENALNMFQAARSSPVFTECKLVHNLGVINLKLDDALGQLVALDKEIAGYKSGMESVQLDIDEVKTAIAKEVPHLQRTRTVYTAIPRGKPRSTCAHDSCTTQSDGVKLALKVCHDNCQLEGIQSDTGAVPGLKMCAMFHPAYDGRKCTNCEHGWESHVHLYVDYTVATVTFDDPTVKAALELKMARHANFLSLLQALESKVARQEMAQKVYVNNCSACFVYLRLYSYVRNQQPLAEQIEAEIQVLRVSNGVNPTSRVQAQIDSLEILASLCRRKLQEMLRTPPPDDFMPPEIARWLEEGHIRMDEGKFRVVTISHPSGGEWILPPTSAATTPDVAATAGPMMPVVVVPPVSVQGTEMSVDPRTRLHEENASQWLQGFVIPVVHPPALPRILQIPFQDPWTSEPVLATQVRPAASHTDDALVDYAAHSGSRKYSFPSAPPALQGGGGRGGDHRNSGRGARGGRGVSIVDSAKSKVINGLYAAATAS